MTSLRPIADNDGMNVRVIVVLWMAALPGTACSASAVGVTPNAVAIPNDGGDSCAVRIRAASAGDMLVREQDPVRGAPENANDAPGPGSLRAVVRSDSLHHPFIFILDTATSVSRRLCPGSRPRFSPDGRWIACSRWVSRERPYTLARVDLQTGVTQLIEGIGQIEDFAWSPDSKRLAFTSMRYDLSSRCQIGWVDMASDSVRLLATDSDPYVEYHECEWAPDSRRFVVNRDREYEHDDRIKACDLWLLDVDGKPCRLTHTPRVDKSLPGWIDRRRVRYEAMDSDTGEGSRYVIELSPAPPHR